MHNPFRASLVAIDRENADVLKKKAEKITADSLKDLPDMTLTVVDGNFPREVLSKQNLTFATFKMPARLNNSLKYDANRFGAGLQKRGILIQTGLLERAEKQQIANTGAVRPLVIFSLFLLGLIAVGSIWTQ